MSAPPPRVSVEADPVIPYVEEKDYPEHLRPILAPYQERMGFLPNALKVYMHRPEIAETLWKLNSLIMRDGSSTVPQRLKRKLGAVASTTNGCAYCTAHNCGMLRGEPRGGAEGWGMSDDEVTDLIDGTGGWDDDGEKAAIDYVRAASDDPSNVPVELLEEMKKHWSPAQIVEIGCVVGFWKFYNAVHDSLHIPIETHVLGDTGWVDLSPARADG